MFKVGDNVLIKKGVCLYGQTPSDETIVRYDKEQVVLTITNLYRIRKDEELYNAEDRFGVVYFGCRSSAFIHTLTGILTKKEIKRINKLNNVRE